jgi:hypothetical protein
MPGEAEAPVRHLYIFDIEGKKFKSIKTAAFKDQELRIHSTPVLQKNISDDINSNTWLGTENKFYITRISRDLKRVDICSVNIAEDSCRTLIKERMNTYVETRALKIINGGKELFTGASAPAGHNYTFTTKTEILKTQLQPAISMWTILKPLTRFKELSISRQMVKKKAKIRTSPTITELTSTEAILNSLMPVILITMQFHPTTAGILSTTIQGWMLLLSPLYTTTPAVKSWNLKLPT